jgi:hypothetical protein
MGVLSSLLPGLRDLRAPLAAGYIWLLNIWLLFGDDIPSQEEASGAFESLYRLGKFVPQLGKGIAISFVAYLIGALSQSASNSLLGGWRRFIDRVIDAQNPRSWLMRGGGGGWLRILWRRTVSRDQTVISPRFNRGVHQYASHIRRRINDAAQKSRLSLVEILPMMSEDLRRRLLTHDRSLTDEGIERAFNTLLRQAFSADREILRARLIADEQMLYGEFDRYQSEAEFRSSISIPLGGLAIILAVLIHPIWLLFLFVIVWLWVQADLLEDRADLALIAGVTAEKIDSPTLQAAEAAIQQARDPERVQGHDTD